MNRKAFYDHIRKVMFSGIMSGKQVEGIEAILNEWEKRGLTDKRWLAYMLATTFHETARTMQPIEEYGRGKGRKYGIPDINTGKTYYGRGFVQLTWLSNYQTFERLLKQPLTTQPELALDLKISTEILFTGMEKGLFTGKRLSDYFNADKEDWIHARRIINGMDCAETIASYANKFYTALK